MDKILKEGQDCKKRLFATKLRKLFTTQSISSITQTTTNTLKVTYM
jgi:hypothetical protein